MRPTITNIATLLAAAAMLAALGCGGTGGNVPSVGTQPPSALALLPAPADALRQAAATDAQRRLLGNAYLSADEYWHNVSVPGGETSALFAPNFAGASTDLAYCIYSFTLPDYTDANEVRLGWSTTPFAENVWLGLGEWGGNTWRWQQADSSQVFTLDSLAPYISAGDQLVAAVVLLGADTAKLADITIGSEVQPPAGGFDAFSFGGSGQDHARACVIDGNGDLIVVALFEGTINADRDGLPAGELTSSGLVDTAIIKYNAAGGLLWAESVGGSGSVDVPHGVDVDSAGNIYVCGYFGNSETPGAVEASFDPAGIAPGAVLSSDGGLDAYLAKYDADGAYQWALGLGNVDAESEERAWDLAVDSAGNVALAGVFTGTVGFNPLGVAPVILTSESPLDGHDLFMARYDAQGVCQGAFNIKASIDDVAGEGYCAVDYASEGGIVFAGNFTGFQIDVDPGVGDALATAAGPDMDVLLAKYSGDGNYIDHIVIGGSGQTLLSPGAMRVGTGGKVAVTGNWLDTILLDPDGIDYKTNFDGTADIFTAVYNFADLDYNWGFVINSAPGPDGGHRVAFDNGGNLYLAGWFRGTGDFDPDPFVTEYISSAGDGDSGGGDSFLARYGPDGTYQWAHMFGSDGSTNLGIAAGLAVDPSDNTAVICGQLWDTDNDFDTDPVLELLLSSSGENDIYVAKYSTAGELW